MQPFTSAKGVIPRLEQFYSRRNIADLQRYENAFCQFKRLYGGNSAYFCSSSGRVELVGNHTDHNGGKVVACTVDLDVIAAFRPNGTDFIQIAGNKRKTLTVPVGGNASHSHSAGLVMGVVRYLAEQGYKVGGFDAYTDSTIPVGAGVSSSAAFELLVGAVLSALFNNGGIPADVLARAGQFAENVYFGKPCGLMDQSVIALGGVVALDFADGVLCEKLDERLSGLSLVLVNTGKSHASLTDLYAAIPADMRAVARFFGKERLVEVESAAFFAHYDNVARSLGERAALRAKHFFEENARVTQLIELLAPTLPQAQAELRQERNRAILSIVNASGDSSMFQLRNCAVDEQDTAIADVISFARGVCPCAARVHGGGFAGTVLCVVPSDSLSDFVSAAADRFGSGKVFPLKLRPVGTTIL